MDPLTQFLDMIKGLGGSATPPQTMSPGTAGMTAFADPANAAATGAAAGAAGAMTGATTPAKSGPGLGDILGAIKMPEQKAQFTGGVQGVTAPFRTAMPNVLGPTMSQLTQPGVMPTLGALLSQAPGGGR